MIDFIYIYYAVVAIHLILIVVALISAVSLPDKGDWNVVRGKSSCCGAELWQADCTNCDVTGEVNGEVCQVCDGDWYAPDEWECSECGEPCLIS